MSEGHWNWKWQKLFIRPSISFRLHLSPISMWPNFTVYWLFLRPTNATHGLGRAHIVVNLSKTNEICVSCRWAINQSQNRQSRAEASSNWLGNQCGSKETKRQTGFSHSHSHFFFWVSVSFAPLIATYTHCITWPKEYKFATRQENCTHCLHTPRTHHLSHPIPISHIPAAKWSSPLPSPSPVSLPAHWPLLQPSSRMLRCCASTAMSCPRATSLRKWLSFNRFGQISRFPTVSRSFANRFLVFFSVETSDGKSHQEEGQLKDVGTDHEAIVVRGSYAYVGDDGQTYSIQYLADENGFQPEGAHLPRPVQWIPGNPIESHSPIKFQFSTNVLTMSKFRLKNIIILK